MHFYLDFLLVYLNRCWAHLTCCCCCCCFSLLLLLAILHVIRHVAKYVVVADYALQICSRHNLHSRKKEAEKRHRVFSIHTYIGSQPERVRHSSMALPFPLFFSSRHLNEVGASCHTSLAIATAAAAADYARGPAKAINMQRKTTTNTICCTTITTTTIIMNIRKFVRQLMVN